MGNNYKKIGYIISMPKGIESFIYSEIKELINDGFEIHIFPTKFSKGPYMPEKGWKIYNYNLFLLIIKEIYYAILFRQLFWKYLFFAVRTIVLLEFLIGVDFAYGMKKRKIERIHCHFGDKKLFIGFFCREFYNKPLSVTIHAHGLYHNPNKKFFSKIINTCDQIITISNYNRKILEFVYKINKNKIHVIRLFVDLEKFKMTKKKYIRKERDTKVILTVARFTEYKGHKILFEAIKKINRNEIKVWLVGRGSLDINALARKVGIESNVKNFGTVSDEKLIKLYQDCDIFCLPSITKNGEKEGIPVSLMEAMASGKPVITTRHSGIPELVEEILVEENNVDELRRAIEQLLDNPYLRRKLGEKNRKIIEEKYSKRNIMKLKEIFMEVCDEVLEKD